MKRCLIIINPSSGKHIIQNKLDRIIGQLTLQNIVEHFEIFYTEKKEKKIMKKKMMPIIKQKTVMKINMILSCLLVVMVL